MPNMSAKSKYPRCAMRKICPCILPWPFAIIAPKRSLKPLTMTLESMPAGALTAAHRTAGPFGENLQPEFLTSFTSAAREQLRVFDQVGHADFLDVFQRFSKRKNQRRRRGPAGIVGIGALFLLLEAEVIVRQRCRVRQLPRLGAD